MRQIVGDLSGVLEYDLVGDLEGEDHEGVFEVAVRVVPDPQMEMGREE